MNPFRRSPPALSPTPRAPVGLSPDTKIVVPAENPPDLKRATEAVTAAAALKDLQNPRTRKSPVLKRRKRRRKNESRVPSFPGLQPPLWTDEFLLSPRLRPTRSLNSGRVQKRRGKRKERKSEHPRTGKDHRRRKNVHDPLI